jgi:ketosteroid isomerase-like protein
MAAWLTSAANLAQYRRVVLSVVNSKHCVILVAAAVLPLSGFCQSPAGSAQQAATAMASAPDGVELTQLLKDFLAGASRNDIAAHERFWADDVIYTSSAGRRRGKSEILQDVRKEPAADSKNEHTTYSAEDIRIQQYSTTAVVAFRLVGTTTKNSETEIGRYLNTGTFLKRNEKWQVVAWQATKMATDDEPKK